MEISSVIYYLAGGCLLVLIVAFVINFSVNALIKQFTENAMRKFQVRLSEEVGRALADFKAEVGEHMAQQERKSEALAVLYAALIDLVRDGKNFAASLDKGDRLLTERTLLTFEEAGRCLGDHNRKQSLYYSEEFKKSIENFLAEQEAMVRAWDGKWKANDRDPVKRKRDCDEIRKGWASFEDRAAAVMELTRSEFRSRSFGPESVMKTWLVDAPVIIPPGD